MSDLTSISSLFSSRSSAPVRSGDDAASRVTPATELKPSPRGEDSVELSARARLIASLTETAQDQQPIRTDLVERVRAEIADGTYDTPEKLSAAAWKLSKSLDTNA